MDRIGGIRTIPTRENPHRGRSAISLTGRTLSMHLRPIVPMGLALIASTGCQSYFPYGYGNTNPYPSMPGSYSSPGATTPSRAAPNGASPSGPGQFPMPSNGQTNLNSGQIRGQSAKGSVPDPRFSSPGNTPTTLGAPATDEEEIDSIRRGFSKNESPGKRIDAGDEGDESLSSLDEEKFASPTLYRPALATSDDFGIRRSTAKPRPSPYLKDPKGYAWLRGVVARDPKTKTWRITYSRDPLNDDPYGGTLTLVESSLLDTLMDDDVVLVKGDVDPSARDRYGKPSYRATSVWPLTPKEE